MSLVLRNIKQTPLTHTEMDNNLNYLEDNLIDNASGSGNSTLTLTKKDSSVVTVNLSHTHTTSDLPLATEAQALAGTSITTVMNPAMTKVVVDNIDISGILKPVFISSNYNAQKDQMILVDTTNSSITITLPSSPSNGDIFQVVDVKNNSEINNIIIDGNENTINGSLENLIMNFKGYSLFFIYDNGNYQIIDNLFHY